MFKKAALIFTAVASLTIANTAHAWIGGYHFDYWDTARYGEWTAAYFDRKAVFHFRFGYVGSIGGHSVFDASGHYDPSLLPAGESAANVVVNIFLQFRSGPPDCPNVSVENIRVNIPGFRVVTTFDDTPPLKSVGIVTVGAAISAREYVAFAQAQLKDRTHSLINWTVRRRGRLRTPRTLLTQLEMRHCRRTLQMVPAMKHPRLNVSDISGACLLRSRKLSVVALGKLAFC